MSKRNHTTSVGKTERSCSIRKVVIANRGEIAMRICRTAREMGIECVAVYAFEDRNAAHVKAADQAVELDGPDSISAYLNADGIVDVCRQVGADAVHPGYGFLAENAAFAKQVCEAGITFVGPHHDVIELMGDKIKSREFAAANGVPVAPSAVPTRDFDSLLSDAKDIGFPLLIKASAGGGGKGMSIVRSAAELEEGAKKAASEAERYFGDGRIYAELYVERPRHIEVQVFGDGTGSVVHLFERECSVQRRFQKIIEEAPSAGLPEKLREQICAAAVKLASTANYLNAGTVEFILAPDGRFFFLEMNTRLQVEHPVTEFITGLDLVRLQFEIAAGHPLPVGQSDITTTGHAIECRICAEDPARDFMPEIGKVLKFQPPVAPYIRFEHGLKQGTSVTASFDPMLAKLVVHGGDRKQAIDRSIKALADLTLLGVKTNVEYLSQILDHATFREGRLHTGFVQEYSADLKPHVPSEFEKDSAVIAAALAFREFRDLAFNVPEPYASIGGWRN